MVILGGCCGQTFGLSNLVGWISTRVDISTQSRFWVDISTRPETSIERQYAVCGNVFRNKWVLITNILNHKTFKYYTHLNDPEQQFASIHQRWTHLDVALWKEQILNTL